MNIATAISNAAGILDGAGIAEARREASSLMAFVLKEDAAFLIAHSDDSLAAPYKMMFDGCVRRRAKHEPFQYITGRQEFWRLDFEVTSDVLIPRPETEQLVEKAIEILSANDAPRFCEIGVGSGCIAVAILHSVRKAAAVGIDISQNALAVARRNAETHLVADRLELCAGDLFAGVAGRFDMIVSNPPYIPDDGVAYLQPEVRDFEPRSALAGGADGLDIVRRILAASPEHLKPNGYLLFEIGIDQARTVEALFDQAIWQAQAVLPDLQQIPRIVVAGLR